jgi:peptidoglycan/LPS O-acetylase OafA/YrhL
MNQGKSPFHFKYRADIDGLRAIAVLLVLIFHAFPNQFQGGFLGVDIFFVISGFLISSIILGGLNNATFTFKNFFIKRVNRIFPPLILVLVFTNLIGWFGLTGDEYKELGRHTASGAFFIANITYWLKAGYFDTASELKPLLHLWSLAVEEQFYFIWPIILYFIHRWKKSLIFTTLSLIITSFAVCLYLSFNDPNAAFYLPYSRFWEILLGALLAFLVSKRQGEITPKFANMKSLFGLSLIIFSSFLVSKKDIFPGYWALFPTIGTCLIISAGQNSWINKYILSNKNLVWVGLISYPLYLWHWPFFSLSRVITAEPLSLYVKFFLLILTFIFSWLTYKFYELPIRKMKSPHKPLFFLLCIIIIGIFGAITKGSKGFPSRGADPINNYHRLSSGFEGNDLMSCTSKNISFKTSSYCTKNANATVLITGDSHAPQLYYGLKRLDQLKNGKVDVLAAITCNPVMNFYNDDNCNKLLDNILKRVESKDNKLKYVIIASYYRVYEGLIEKNKVKYLTGYTSLFNELLKNKVKPIFYIDNYAFTKDPMNCVKSDLILRRRFANIPSLCSGPKSNDILGHSDYDKFVTKLKALNPSVTFFDSRQTLCPNGKCKMFEGKKLLYSDINHVSIFGSELIANDLIQHMEEL